MNRILGRKAADHRSYDRKIVGKNQMTTENLLSIWEEFWLFFRFLRIWFKRTPYFLSINSYLQSWNCGWIILKTSDDGCLRNDHLLPPYIQRSRKCLLINFPSLVNFQVWRSVWISANLLVYWNSQNWKSVSFTKLFQTENT